MGWMEVLSIVAGSIAVVGFLAGMARFLINKFHSSRRRKEDMKGYERPHLRDSITTESVGVARSGPQRLRFVLTTAPGIPEWLVREVRVWGKWPPGFVCPRRYLAHDSDAVWDPHLGFVEFKVPDPWRRSVVFDPGVDWREVMIHPDAPDCSFALKLRVRSRPHVKDDMFVQYRRHVPRVANTG